MTAGLGLAFMIVGAAACSGTTAVLTQQIDARRLASSLHVQFSKTAEASNRAVMSDADESSKAAAREAEQATQAVERDADALQRLLQALGYRDEIGQLDTFTAHFAEYRRLDADILPLAVENTNVKAQRLSFGPARDAARAFRQSLEAAAGSAASKGVCCVDALAAKAAAALSEMQVIQAQHIAESDEAAMSRMEAEMAASEAAVRKALSAQKSSLAPAAAPHLAAATTALDRFMAINAEIVKLSRRNSNVRSLALSLGRKRVVTALCDDALNALEESLAKHDFGATR